MLIAQTDPSEICHCYPYDNKILSGCSYPTAGWKVGICKKSRALLDCGLGPTLHDGRWTRKVEDAFIFAQHWCPSFIVTKFGQYVTFLHVQATYHHSICHGHESATTTMYRAYLQFHLLLTTSCQAHPS